MGRGKTVEERGSLRVNVFFIRRSLAHLWGEGA